MHLGNWIQYAVPAVNHALGKTVCVVVGETLNAPVIAGKRQSAWAAICTGSGGVMAHP